MQFDYAVNRNFNIHQRLFTFGMFSLIIFYMGLIDRISEARLATLHRMQQERNAQRFPTVMPHDFFTSQRWFVDHERVSGLIARVVPQVMDEVGIPPLDYSQGMGFRAHGDLRQVFHIVKLGHPDSWAEVRSPDSYKLRSLHEIDLRAGLSVVRLQGSWGEILSSLFTESVLREYIISRLEDPRIVLPG